MNNGVSLFTTNGAVNNTRPVFFPSQNGKKIATLAALQVRI
jgi:hypothetical protein